MTKDRQEEGAVARIVVTVLLVAVSAMILFLACKRDQEGPSRDQVGTKSAVELLRQQRGVLSEWEMLQMAIAYTESRFRPDAIGSDQDFGVLQITPIYVREVNRVCGTEFAHEDALSVDKSLEMFALMQDAKNPQKDKDLAIYLHNKSAAYRQRVLENLEMIRRYEEVRAKVKGK